MCVRCSSTGTVRHLPAQPQNGQKLNHLGWIKALDTCAHVLKVFLAGLQVSCEQPLPGVRQRGGHCREWGWPMAGQLLLRKLLIDTTQDVCAREVYLRIPCNQSHGSQHSNSPRTRCSLVRAAARFCAPGCHLIHGPNDPPPLRKRPNTQSVV